MVSMIAMVYEGVLSLTSVKVISVGGVSDLR